MTKEALKLALEAMILNNAEWKRLADSGDGGYWSAEEQDHYKQTEQAIIAIKEALAQPEHIGFIDSKLNPIQRTWVGLTDDEIAECAERMEASDPTDSFWREFAQAIEAKLKEKNRC